MRSEGCGEILISSPCLATYSNKDDMCYNIATIVMAYKFSLGSVEQCRQATCCCAGGFTPLLVCHDEVGYSSGSFNSTGLLQLAGSSVYM